MIPGLIQYKLTFQISPIFLTGGIAAGIAGGTVPIINYTQSIDFSGLGSTGPDVDLDNFFAYFQPTTGTSIILNQLGTYPFANQQTAANAVITQPLHVSMLMICPARQPGDYARKLSIMTALQGTLAKHVLAGGTFTVVTPSYVFTDCVLTGFRDASGAESKQMQWRWQLDFEKPLVALAEAQQAQNNLVQSLSNGQQITPNATGQITGGSGTTGNVPSAVSPSVVPSSQSNPAPGGGIIASGSVSGGGLPRQISVDPGATIQ